jgi:hypothetical protein
MEDLVAKTIDLDPMINYARRVQIVRGAVEKIHDDVAPARTGDRPAVEPLRELNPSAWSHAIIAA